MSINPQAALQSYMRYCRTGGGRGCAKVNCTDCKALAELKLRLKRKIIHGTFKELVLVPLMAKLTILQLHFIGRNYSR